MYTAEISYCKKIFCRKKERKVNEIFLMLEMIIIIEGRMGHEIKIKRDSLEINRVEKDSFICRQQL